MLPLFPENEREDPSGECPTPWSALLLALANDPVYLILSCTVINYPMTRVLRLPRVRLPLFTENSLLFIPGNGAFRIGHFSDPQPHKHKPPANYAEGF